MAEEKKEKKPEGWNLDMFETLILVLLLIGLAGSIIPSILNYISSGEIYFYGYRISDIFDFFSKNSWFFKILGFIIAGLGAIGTITWNKMSDAIWAAERARLYPKNMKELMLGADAVEQKKTQSRWQRIVMLSESSNPSDWKLSIIEADIMLDDLLTNLRLPGETMGEKLKAVEKSDFTTIDYAWEAHKARNMIAHEGPEFLLNQRETRRIISLYEAVFKEFEMI